MNDKALDGAILDILGGIIPLQGVGELTDDQYDKLFNLFQDQHEMPYRPSGRPEQQNHHQGVTHGLRN
jgi:hypothetical protein